MSAPPPAPDPAATGGSWAKKGCLWLLGGFGVVLLLGSIFGQDGGSGLTVTCSSAPRSVLDDVATGLTTAGHGSLSDGRLGKVQGSAGTYLVAEIDAPGMEDDGQWAVWWLGGSGSNPGSIFAIDGLAREFSDWGAAAQPGSPADDARKARASEARAVKRQCA